MGRLFSLEAEELEVDRAAEAAAKSESTDPADITLVANYRDEIEKLRAESGDAGTDGGDPADPDSGAMAGDDPAATADTTGDAGDPADTGSAEPATTAAPEATKDVKDDEGEGENEEAEIEEPEGAAEEGEKVEPGKDATAALEAAFDSLIGLHRIHQVVQRAQKAGGLTPVGARYVQLAVESFAQKVGCPVTAGYSLEAFDSYSTREHETSIVLESVGGVAQRIWENVKRFFAALFRWVRDWIFGAQKQTVEVAKTIKKTEEVLKAAEKKVVAPDVRERIETKIYRAYSKQLLSVTGDADAADIARGFESVVALWTAIDKFTRGPMRKVVETCMERLDSETARPDDTLIFFRRTDLAAFQLKATPRGLVDVDKSMFAGVVGPMPGGSYTLVQAFLDTGKPTQETLPFQQVTVDYMKDVVEGGIPLTLDMKVLNDLKTNIQNFQRKTMSFYSTMAANNKDMEDFVNGILEDQADGAVWVNKSSEEVAALTKVLSLNQATMSKFMVKLPNDLKVYTDRTITGILDYINTCGAAILSAPTPKPTV